MPKRHRNYNQYSNNTISDSVEKNEPDNTNPVDDEALVEDKDPYINGKVFNCPRLTVREHPNINSVVLTEIPVDTEIRIDTRFVDDSNQWYKIVTVAGLEGYCMQDYISLTE